MPDPTVGRPAPGRDDRSATAPWRTAANVLASLSVLAWSIGTEPQLLAGFAVAALIAASLEALVPLRDQQRRPLRAYVTDLTEALGNRCLIVPAASAAVTVLEPAVQLLTLDAVPRAVDQLGWPSRLALVLVTTDLAGYLGHRMSHRVPALWRLHRVHHSSEQLDWLATSRGHALDQVVGLLVMAVPALALGAPTEGGVVIAFLYVYPFVVHANVRIRLGVLERVLVSPRFHHWHHAGDVAGHDRNFATLLTVWDHLLGTVAEPRGFPDSYGIGDPELAHGDYLTHLTTPFRRRRPPATRPSRAPGGLVAVPAAS